MRDLSRYSYSPESARRESDRRGSPSAEAARRKADRRRTSSSEPARARRRAAPARRRRRRWPWVLAAIVAIVALAGLFGYPAAMRAYYRLDYQDLIQEAADRYEVNPYWIAAMIKCESNFEPDAVSSAGAVGLMQLMPDTAQHIADMGLVDSGAYSPEDLTDPETNINYGTAYIRYLVERYHVMDNAIAAYNAGPGNVDEWLAEGENIWDTVGFSETASYLELVTRAKAAYEEYYPDAFEWG